MPRVLSIFSPVLADVCVCYGGGMTDAGGMTDGGGMTDAACNVHILTCTGRCSCLLRRGCD